MSKQIKGGGQEQLYIVTVKKNGHTERKYFQDIEQAERFAKKNNTVIDGKN